jgi:DsbC/DsbD-like thiol-disulfide interchange protein
MTTNARRGLLVAAFVTGLVLGAPAGARAQAKKSDSVVKAAAKADKPGADGKQVVTVTLTIDKGWHIYANPVGLSDLDSAQTTLKFTGKLKPEAVKIDYPAGKVVKDAVLGDYKIYKDKVTIKATVQRAKGDTSPLEVSASIQACNDRGCLLPSTIKVPVR